MIDRLKAIATSDEISDIDFQWINALPYKNLDCEHLLWLGCGLRTCVYFSDVNAEIRAREVFVFASEQFPLNLCIKREFACLLIHSDISEDKDKSLRLLKYAHENGDLDSTLLYAIELCEKGLKQESLEMLDKYKMHTKFKQVIDEINEGIWDSV